MVKNQKWFWPAAIVAAWAFDFLFFGKTPGISVPIWTALVLLIGFGLCWSAGKRPSLWTIPVALLTLFFSFVPAFRTNGSTVAFAVMMLAGGLLLIAATFLTGNWFWFRMVDYIVEFAKVLWAAISRPFQAFSSPQDLNMDGQPAPASFWKKTAPVLRGVLIAIPVLAVFTALFASADEIFNEGLKQLINLERLPEYTMRLVFILVIGFLLVGVFLHAIAPTKSVNRPDPAAAWMKPFLGFTESGILLGAVDILFAIFVIVQIRYLFGGQANISETGFTYAEYARRGFGELVAVAVLSMLLYLGLGTVSRLQNKRERIFFSAASVLLMVMVLVILASSLQRLLLYEKAYGFSELRTLTHVFVYWLAALILAAVVLELLRNRGRFALALLVAVVGFSLTLAVMNVDGFVVRQNVQRAAEGEELDLEYLSTLSSDAVPALVELYQKPGLSSEVHQALGIDLACRTEEMREAEKPQWQSINFGALSSDNLLEKNANLWKQVKLQKDSAGLFFEMTDHEKHYCSSFSNWD